MAGDGDKQSSVFALILTNPGDLVCFCVNARKTWLLRWSSLKYGYMSFTQISGAE